MLSTLTPRLVFVALFCSLAFARPTEVGKLPGEQQQQQAPPSIDMNKQQNPLFQNPAEFDFNDRLNLPMIRGRPVGYIPLYVFPPPPNFRQRLNNIPQSKIQDSETKLLGKPEEMQPDLMRPDVLNPMEKMIEPAEQHLADMRQQPNIHEKADSLQPLQTSELQAELPPGHPPISEEDVMKAQEKNPIIQDEGLNPLQKPLTTEGLPPGHPPVPVDMFRDVQTSDLNPSPSGMQEESSMLNPSKDFEFPAGSRPMNPLDPQMGRQQEYPGPRTTLSQQQFQSSDVEPPRALPRNRRAPQPPYFYDNYYHDPFYGGGYGGGYGGYPPYGGWGDYDVDFDIEYMYRYY